MSGKWVVRKRRPSDFKTEIEAHIQLEAERLREQGMSEEGARAAAHRAFGNVTKTQERFYERGRWLFWDNLWRDVRYALRMLRKSPGFTAVAILTLALGIGANTAIFSALYGILLKPLPYPDSSRLVQLWVGNPAHGRIAYIRVRDFREVASQSHMFEQLGEYLEGGSTITGTKGPEGVQTSYVSGDFFSALGAKPILGRPILPADAEPGHNQVAVLSYDLWQRRYDGDPGIVGKTITIMDRTDSEGSRDNPSTGEPYTVIGVMPSRFPFPNHGDLLLPEASWEPQFQLIAIGRLKQGVPLASANSELHTIAARISAETPAGHKNFDLFVGLLRDRMSEGYSTEFLILLGAVGFVLLLACVNVSSLLVARSWARQKEVAIRETLGATRGRLVRQLLSESVLLALLGAALGLLFAHWGINVLRDMAPPYTPRLDEVGLDGTVLAYTLGIALFAGIVFGLAPAMHLTHRGSHKALKELGSGSLLRLNFRGPQRLRNILVIGEISLAFVLVVGAALALRSFSNLMNVKLGFRPTQVLTMYVSFSPAIRTNPQRIRPAMDEVLERIRSLPGVQNSAFGEWLPIGGGSMEGNVQVEGKPNSAPVEQQLVTPEYFSTLGIPFLAGRSFNDGDIGDFSAVPHKSKAKSQATGTLPIPESGSAVDIDRTKVSLQGAPPVAIVNEAFARRYFDGRPLGKQFQVSGLWDKPVGALIVGEVADTRDWSLERAGIAEYYIPFAQVPVVGETTLLVRTAANPMGIAKAVREQVGAVDDDAPVDDMITMDTLISQQVAEPRFQTLLLSAFGGLGLLLALVGVYGLISYAAVQRTHEIGLRMALGAGRGDVLRMILGEGLLLALIGIAIGIAGALALTRFLRSLLFEIKPTDPATYVGVAILLAVVALAACYIPARRAMKVDPMVALRYE